MSNSESIPRDKGTIKEGTYLIVREYLELIDSHEMIKRVLFAMLEDTKDLMEEELE